MRPVSQIWFLAVLVAVMIVVLALQRQVTTELRDTLALLRGQKQQVVQLRAEQARLVRAQISPAELESLRADHAALVRLRSEVEAAKTRLLEMERAASASRPAN